MHAPRNIGSSALRVNAIGFGAWQLSNENRPGDEAAFAVVRAAADGGATLIDTADAYCLNDEDFGHNEALVCRALRHLGLQGQMHVATKVGCRRPGGAWTEDGRPEWIKPGCEASLTRLGVECIELYQLHWVDARTPIEESVGAMADLQREGKVQHLGLCNVDGAQLERACRVATIASVQNKCNPWAQEDAQSGFIDACAQRGVTYIPWYPVGGADGHKACASNPALLELAEIYGISPYRVLLAWLLGLGKHVLPIPGASRVASITDSLGAVKVILAPEHQAQVGAIAGDSR